MIDTSIILLKKESSIGNNFLARFDLYFDRQDQETDTVKLIEFLHESSELIQKKYTRKHKCVVKYGFILTINKRKNPRYIRIYRKKNKKLNSSCLRFEYELKKQALKNYQSLLLSNQLDEFEDQLSRDFIFYLSQIVPLKYCFTDWLKVKRRSLDTLKTKKLVKNNKNSRILRTHYLKPDKFKEIDEQKKFILFLQFLEFAKHLSYYTEQFGIEIDMPMTYRFVSFKIKDFLLFQYPNHESINYHRLRYLRKFFDDLEDFSVKSVVSCCWANKDFRILSYIPMARVFKDPYQQNCWIANIYLAEPLFDSNYPLILPDFLTSPERFQKDAFIVGFQFIQTICSENVQKTFLIKEFLEPYRNQISNQRICNMKRDFIQLPEY